MLYILILKKVDMLTSGKQGGVWKKYKNSKKLKTIQGIGQLFTNQELITYG